LPRLRRQKKLRPVGSGVYFYQNGLLLWLKPLRCMEESAMSCSNIKKIYLTASSRISNPGRSG
jgi:hypothetical protein